MERQRRLDGRGTPRGRRSFVNRGQLDAPDTDVHFGGLAAVECRCAPAVLARPARRADANAGGGTKRVAVGTRGRGCGTRAGATDSAARSPRVGQRAPPDPDRAGCAHRLRAGSGSSPAHRCRRRSGNGSEASPWAMPGSLRDGRSTAFDGAATEATGAAASGELACSPAGGSNVAGKAA